MPELLRFTIYAIIKFTITATYTVHVHTSLRVCFQAAKKEVKLGVENFL